MRRRVITILIIVIILGIGGGILAHFRGQKGEVSINFNLLSGQGLTTTLNGKPFAITGLQSAYSLHPGSYTFVASKQNYRTTSASFTLHNGQHLVLTLAMQRSITATLTNWQQVEGVTQSSNVTIGQVQYFYQNTWAVATVMDSSGDTAVVTLNYDDSSNKWDAVLGPGTFFQASSLTALPSDVANYLQTNNYVGTGGS